MSKISRTPSDEVIGPESAVDEAVARYDGTSGKVLQDSLVRVSNTGDLTVDGEMKGSRLLLSAGLSSTQTADSSLRGHGVALGTNDGYVMMRAGSIVGASFLAEISAFTDAGTLECNIIKNTTTVFLASVAVSGTGFVQAHATQARGIDTFVAGDRIRFKMVTTGGGSFTRKDVLALCEIVFDT